jgi:hypothetical protein
MNIFEERKKKIWRAECRWEAGALLPELFGGIEREPVQVELSALRVLFELLLLSVKCFASTGLLTCRAISDYNGEGFNTCS